jgi:hypothetical protein
VIEDIKFRDALAFVVIYPLSHVLILHNCTESQISLRICAAIVHDVQHVHSCKQAQKHHQVLKKVGGLHDPFTGSTATALQKHDKAYVPIFSIGESASLLRLHSTPALVDPTTSNQARPRGFEKVFS